MLVALVAVGAALVAWLSSSTERRDARVEPAPEQPEIELAVEPPPPVADYSDDVVASEPVADAPISSQRSRDASTVVLRGTVICALGPLELTEISVTTPRIYAPVLSAAVAADGAFEVDVTSLVVSNDGSELLVDARHPNAIDEHLVVGTQAFRGLAPGEQRVIPLEIVLGRAACTVDVRVNGTGAQVSVSVFGVSGPLLRAGIASDVRYDGSFRFHVPRGEYVLVAHCGGLRPSTVRFGCGQPSHVELEPITLESGAKLSGRVEFRGDPLGWGAVEARLVGAPRATTRALHWTGASFEWSLCEGFVGPKGTFEVSGLAPAEYELLVTRIEHMYGQDLGSRTVIAPASGIMLEPKICRLVLEVLVGGEPKSIEFDTRSAYVRDGAKHTSSTNGGTKSGRAIIWLAPGSSNEAVFDMSEILGVPGAPEKTFQLPSCVGGKELTMYINL